MVKQEIEWKKVEGDGHNFEEQPELIGVLVDLKENNFGGHDYVLETEPKKMVLVRGLTALASKMSSIKLGTKVKIVYLGKKKSQTGMVYNNYDVYTGE